MCRIWIDGTKLFIEAGSISEERLLKVAEERGLIKKTDGVNLCGLDIIWEIGNEKGQRGGGG